MIILYCRLFIQHQLNYIFFAGSFMKWTLQEKWLNIYYCSYFLDSFFIYKQWLRHIHIYNNSKKEINWWCTLYERPHVVILKTSVYEFHFNTVQAAYPMVTPNPHWNLFLRWLRKEQSAKDSGSGSSFFSNVAPTTQLLSIDPTEKKKTWTCEFIIIQQRTTRLYHHRVSDSGTTASLRSFAITEILYMI